MSDVETTQKVDESGVVERAEIKGVRAVAYLLPWFTPVVSTGVWVGVMTFPFFLYLVTIFTIQPEIHLVLTDLFLVSSVLDIAIISIGSGLVLYSVLFLHRNKTNGMVSEGPYRVVRHPQYLGPVLFTAALTSRRVWVLMNHDNLGWISIQPAILVWFLMLVAYVILASIEETYLSKTYGSKWSEYRDEVGFLLPCVTSKTKIVEILVSLAVLYGVMNGLVLFAMLFIQV
ncbi:MAG: methyltransferase family protein [Promethearchaeia archaeon]